MEDPNTNELLGRLLGPSDPEIGCDACFEELDRYVDLEVAGRGRRRGRPRACGHISRAARPAARSTRACSSSSRATRRVSAA